MTVTEAGPRRVHLRDLDGLVGVPLGYSPWHTVDQARITAFAETTEDRQWIHLDEQRAGAGPLGGTIAHGFLTLSMITVLSQELLVVEGVDRIINYGLDRVRFAAAVPAGAPIRATGQVLSTRQRPRGYLEMIMRIRVECDLPGGVERACTAEWVTLLAPAEA